GDGPQARSRPHRGPHARRPRRAPRERPRAEPRARQAMAVTAWSTDGVAQEKPSEPTLTVLVVDDEPNIRKTLRILLESESARVIEAATAADALGAAAREPFDLPLPHLKLAAHHRLHLLPPL